MTFLDINGKQDLDSIINYLAQKHLVGKKTEKISLQANFPLDILFTPEERLTANEVQSKSVKAGNLVEELVRILIDTNPHLNVPRGFLMGPGVLESEANALWAKLTGVQRKKTAIFTHIPKEEIRTRSYEITKKMRDAYDNASSTFRTSYLEKLIEKAKAELQEIPPTLWQKKASVYLIDFAIRNREDQIFLGELKSSGTDGSNPTEEMRALLKATLALSNYPNSIMPIAAIAFPSGSSNSLATVFPGQSIWSGESLWQKILTPPLQFSDLKQSMATILPNYRYAREDVPVVRRRSRKPRS